MAENKNQKPPAATPTQSPKAASSGGSLTALIEQFARGEVDAATVANSIRKEDPNRPATDLTYEQKEKRAMDDDYGDYRGSFSEVTAAWIADELTDEQYNQLRTAFTPEGATSGEEDEAAEGEEEGAQPPQAPPA